MNTPYEENVCTVSGLTREIKDMLENTFPGLWVEGEISNLKRHSSGHLYFSLNDSEAQISCVMWRNRNSSLLFRPQDGMKVMLNADLTVYERHGRYQLDVIRMRPVGIGDLQQAFEELKRRLDAQGLFDVSIKKPLPVYPKRIGVVTSPTGAALRDIRSVIQRRFPSVELILRPVRVQGVTAAQEIARAIEEFNEFGQVDLLIVGRGGGSQEDLWAFNEEVVARAIFASRIPVISAVGHEVDVSISDLVADYRAPTPSVAAEVAVEDQRDLVEQLTFVQHRMSQLMEGQVSRYRERLAMIGRSFGFRRPLDLIRQNRLRLDDVWRALHSGAHHHIEGVRKDIHLLSEKLMALNPGAILQRGYAIVTRNSDGRIIDRASQVSPADSIHVQLSEGALLGTVTSIQGDEEVS